MNQHKKYLAKKYCAYESLRLEVSEREKQKTGFLSP